MDTLEKPNATATGPRDGAQDGMDWSPLPDAAYSFGPLPSHLECEALAQGFPSRAGLASLRKAGVSNRIIGDLQITEARAKFFPRRRFDYVVEGGIPVLLLMVLDTFREVTDVVAWPIDRPEKWACLTGKSTLLGEQELNATTLGEPVPVWRTPLAWMASGCRGIVILDSTYAWRKLRCGPPLSGEDLEHAKEIQVALAPPGPPQVYVRNPPARKAAA